VVLACWEALFAALGHRQGERLVSGLDPSFGPERTASYTCAVPSKAAAEQTYTLYRRGIELLEDGDFADATEPLAEAARRAPEKSSVREALGRAYYRAGRFAQAAVEFEAVVETHHVNDYAHFCLGRALSKTGQRDRARHHLALASNLCPDRRDYRYYRRLLDA
jgi:tetratricopeptide (TPR) repeat protein